MKILRDGEERTVSLKVSLLQESQVSDYVQNWLGFSVDEIKQSMVRRYSLATSQGVIVMSVAPNGVSSKIGIRPGDIIRQINQVRIKNGNDFRAAMVKAAGRDTVLLLIQRGQSGYYVTLEP
jgi:serine protease Do